MRPMVVLSLVLAQLGLRKMVNTFMTIGHMELVHTSLGEIVNTLKTRNKILPLHVYACLSFRVCGGTVPFLYPYATLVFTCLLSLPYAFLFLCCVPPGWVGGTVLTFSHQ